MAHAMREHEGARAQAPFEDRVRLADKALCLVLARHVHRLNCMSPSSIRRTALLGACVVWGAVVTEELPSLRAATPHLTAAVRFDNERVHRSGCLDAKSREQHPDGDVVRIRVSRRTTLVATLRGAKGLEPALVAIADQGAASELGWSQIIGAETAFERTILLPDEGTYAFIATDRRHIAGNELVADEGCFDLTLAPAAPTVAASVQNQWRGRIDHPVLLEPVRSAVYTATNTSARGSVGVAVIEDDELTSVTVLSAGESAKIVVTGSPLFTAVIFYEATSDGAPLTSQLSFTEDLDDRYSDPRP